MDVKHSTYRRTQRTTMTTRIDNDRISANSRHSANLSMMRYFMGMFYNYAIYGLVSH